MNSNTKRIFSVAIIIVLVIALLLPSFIYIFNPVNAKTLDEAKKATQEAQEKVDQAKLKKDEAAAKLATIDAELNAISDEIVKTEEKISQLDEQITIKNEEITNKTNELNAKQAIYDQRITVMYEQGTSGYLAILFQSDNLFEFFDNYELVNQLISYDKEVIDAVAEAKEALEAAKQDLEDTKEERETELAVQQESQAAYETKQAEAKAVYDTLAADLVEFEALLDAAQAEQDSIAGQIAAMTASVPSSGASFVGTGQFQWPCPGYTTITSNFGYRIHPVLKTQRYHSGTDISAPTGASILAAASGTVIMAGYNTGGYGNYVVIDHGGGVTTLYAHASQLCVSRGQSVTAGQLIAKVGSTGMSTGPHLHLEVQVNGQRTDAMAYFR